MLDLGLQIYNLNKHEKHQIKIKQTNRQTVYLTDKMHLFIKMQDIELVKIIQKKPTDQLGKMNWSMIFIVAIYK